MTNATAAMAGDQFTSRAENLLAVGDIWDEIRPEARAAILMLTNAAWVGASGRWSDIPPTVRTEIAHGAYFYRDFLNRVLP